MAYVAIAAVCFVLGAIGVVVPGLPTTPFLLLTSYFLARSWPRLNALLLRSRVLGPILRDWHHHRSVARRVKRTAIAMVLCALVALVLLSKLPPAGLVAVLTAASLGLVVIQRLPTRD